MLCTHTCCLALLLVALLLARGWQMLPLLLLLPGLELLLPAAATLHGAWGAIEQWHRGCKGANGRCTRLEGVASLQHTTASSTMRCCCHPS
jgi:hypothetical protein